MKFDLIRPILATLLAGSLATWSASVQGQSPSSTSDPTEAGKAVFKRANCVGCHKWHGNGGGGYGGDALSLRKTELTRDQIIETVTCGRPSTGMPYFSRDAYGSTKCYDMTREDVGNQKPPESNTFLRPPDIQAVADYVLAHIKGRGDPTFAECTDFFGNASRVCDIYKAEAPSPGGAAPSEGQSK